MVCATGSIALESTGSGGVNVIGSGSMFGIDLDSGDRLAIHTADGDIDIHGESDGASGAASRIALAVSAHAGGNGAVYVVGTKLTGDGNGLVIAGDAKNISASDGEIRLESTFREFCSTTTRPCT